MAANIQPFNFKLGAKDYGAVDFADALRKGFENYKQFHEAKNTPQKLAEALYAQQLQNKINKPKAEHAEESILADLAHIRAATAGTQSNTYAQNIRNKFLPEKEKLEIEKLKSPPAISGETAQLFRLRDSLPAGKDRDKVDKIIAKKAEGNAGTQLTVDPDTGAVNFSQGGSNRSTAGQKFITDENGNQIVVSKPTNSQSSAQQQSSLSEIGRSEIARKAEMPYLGTGSNAEILSDRLKYSTHGDKAAGDRLVQAAVAKMIAPEYAGLQLASQGIRGTIPALHHQFEIIKQGWPQAVNIVVENLPEELQQRAKKEHARLLAEIKSAKEQHAAKGFPVKLQSKKNILRYNPETGRLE